MRVEYSRFDLEQTGTIYIATNPDDRNPYYDFLREGYWLEIPVLYMLENLSAGDKFIDVGANLGAITLPIAKSGFETLAIEALPDNYFLLLKALERNRLTNVTAIHAAAYHSSGILRMAGNGPWGHRSPGNTGIPVAAGRVDDFAASCGFSHARFVKIDIEGGELAAIRGMDRFLRENTEVELVFESNSTACRRAGCSTHDLLAELEKLGYSTYMFMFGQKLLVPRTSRDLQELQWVDFLATKRTPQDAFGTFEVRPLTLEERIGLLLQTAEASLVDYREHVAFALEDAPEEIMTDRRVRRALSALVRDPKPEVREAASWATGSPFP